MEENNKNIHNPSDDIIENEEDTTEKFDDETIEQVDSDTPIKKEELALVPSNYYEQKNKAAQNRLLRSKEEYFRRANLNHNDDTKNDALPEKESRALVKVPTKEMVSYNADGIKKEVKKVATSEAKEQLKKEIKKKVGVFLLKYWYILAGAFLILLLLILIIAMLGGGANSDTSQTSYLDEQYDYNMTQIFLTDGSGNILEQLSMSDYILGVAYAMLSDLDPSNNAHLEIYKAYMVVAKSQALYKGNYSNETKEIYIQSGSLGLAYCDIDSGCSIVRENNGVITYVSESYTNKVSGTIISNVDKLSAVNIQNLQAAYNDVAYEILVSKSFNDEITTYNENISFSQNIKNSWINNPSEYDKLLERTYSNLKIYDIRDYATVYEFANTSTYWWPVGSHSQSSTGVYGDKPTATVVTAKYGVSTNGKKHQGIDITGETCQHVIIATKAGEVKKINDNCPSNGYNGSSCGDGYGNYVLIDHGDGIETLYAHLEKDSITVKIGDKVGQGQKVGNMGRSGNATSCHLHFEVRNGFGDVDPLNYISESNPRPLISVGSGVANYVQGTSQEQSVCLTLQKMGFSQNAIAALMSNIKAESNFRTTALGDNGTSYGLCQWHNGRFTKLRNHCGSEYSTVGCQLDYLVYELQNSYKKVYNYLTSNNSAWDMTHYFCYYFEVPAARATSCAKRADNSSAKYLSYVQGGCQ